MNSTLAIGWYGKLPSAGDFVGRSLSREIVDEIDVWLQAGLTQLRLRFPDWQASYVSAPCWSFALPANIWAPTPLLGCIAPSADRVGRFFPLIVLASASNEETFRRSIAPAGAFHRRCSELIESAIARQPAVDQFDQSVAQLVTHVNATQALTAHTRLANDILDILGANASPMDDDTIVRIPGNNPVATPKANTANAIDNFDPYGTECRWWADTTMQSSGTITHQGKPNSQTFVSLFTQVRRSASR